jgi:hypothetical protein
MKEIHTESKKNRYMKRHIKLFESFGERTPAMGTTKRMSGPARDEYIGGLLREVQANLRSVAGWKYDAFEWSQAGSFAFRRGKMSIYATPFWDAKVEFEPILMIGQMEWLPFVAGGMDPDFKVRKIQLTGNMEQDVMHVTGLVMETVERLAELMA